MAVDDRGGSFGAKVVAATELLAPPTGFTAPHRLAIVETSGRERLLVWVEGDLPEPGDTGELKTDPQGRTRWRPQAESGTPHG